LQFGTIDDEGDPNIQPVWFDYDKEREKLMIITAKVTKRFGTFGANRMCIFP
jgi:pyridoxamine 5'-phosphate oxidase-like protein